MKAGATMYAAILKTTLREFAADECPRMAAALSYYTVFSLPPLLVLLLMLVGTFLDPETVRSHMSGQIGAMLGPSGADQVEALVEHASRPDLSGIGAVLGLGALIFGATGALVQLQQALNRAWRVKPDPKKGGGIRGFLTKRVTSLGMVLAIGFLLMVSLLVSALVAAFGDMLPGLIGANISTPLLRLIDFLVSLVAVSLLFAAIFKYVPDAIVRWPVALMGGLFTGVLFTLGKFLIAYYLGRSDPGSAYGAAGSLAVILLWIYYNGLILFLGAEFTEVWARQRGEPLRPEPGAIRVATPGR
jgi:membrane protein